MDMSIFIDQNRRKQDMPSFLIQSVFLHAAFFWWFSI